MKLRVRGLPFQILPPFLLISNVVKLLFRLNEWHQLSFLVEPDGCSPSILIWGELHCNLG